MTRRHDSRAQLRRRHTLAVAVTVAGTYANATLREAVALPRSSCGPFVQLAARGRVTHDMISSNRMVRLLPDAIRRQWPCCSRVDGSEWSDVKKTKSVTRPKSAEEGRGYVPHDHGGARAHALPGDRAVGRTERRYCKPPYAALRGLGLRDAGTTHLARLEPPLPTLNSPLAVR